MRTFLVVLAFLVALPASWLAGSLVANRFLDRRFEPVDLADPPVDLALAAAWSGEDGEARCRIFYRRDLLRHEDALPALRYGLSGSDMATCLSSVDAVRRDGRWPDEFSWDGRVFAASVSTPDEGSPHLFEVLYMSDGDRFAQTRYRVDPATGRPGAFEFRGYFGPARGLGLLLYGGGGGTLVWLALVLWYARRSWARRRGATV